MTGPNRTPQPGRRQLTELLDEARDSTGAGARLLVSGRVVPLDPGVQLTTYRIVQEAPTNVRRHAPGAAVDVELNYTSDALRVRVRDSGPGPVPGRPPDAGHGLLGMRERVATLNGELWTGPAPGGGFLVDAMLPLPEEVPSATPVAAGPDGHPNPCPTERNHGGPMSERSEPIIRLSALVPPDGGERSEAPS
ncbi:hypothetical protein DKT69_12075 [Micromonospora sicca]|uniref:histidine kinase n=1 Tax=Micromonospora sicca TaxID=2202420 RepID=A0A317DLN2_9ACTN|nr:ATP-binding protein [Micromonospora sp. 4G51]PWR15244.1 hypothetical protein DKT69_12075 [Micromonospora sp. 4G51]